MIKDEFHMTPEQSQRNTDFNRGVRAAREIVQAQIKGQKEGYTDNIGRELRVLESLDHSLSLLLQPENRDEAVEKERTRQVMQEIIARMRADVAKGQ